MKEAEEFLTRYGSAQFPHADELLSLLRDGKCEDVVRFPSSAPCRQIAEIYRNRARTILALHGQRCAELCEEFSALASALSESPDEPCIGWHFRSGLVSFSVFEMAQSRRIAGCFRRKQGEKFYDEAEPITGANAV